MKKVLKVIVLTLLMLSVSACSINDSDVIDGEEIKITSYNSLSEINKKAQVNIVIPADVVAENESFHMVGDEIAEYKFKVNGVDYTIRGSLSLDEDISGIYDDEENPAFVNKAAELETYFDDDQKIARFVVNDVQYTLLIEDENGLDEEMFLNICDEYISSITNGQGVDELELYVGDYKDETYQNVSMNIVKGNEEGTLEIVVSYSIDEGNIELWSMTATKQKNSLVYDEGEHFTITTDETRTTTISDTEEIEGGKFVIGDNKLTWNIVIEENEIESIFVKTN